MAGTTGNTGSEAPGPHPIVKAVEMIHAFRSSQIVYTFARLGLADHLADGPRGVADLAAATGADPEGLSRFLRAGVTLGLTTLVPGDEDRFAVTGVGACLGSGPVSVRDLALMSGAPGQWLPWSRLYDAVITGEPTAKLSLGMDLWEYYRRNPVEGEHFADTMGALSTSAAEAVTKAVDLTPYGTIVDVGGSHGVLLTAVLAAAPQARGVLFDLPEVAERARPRLAEQGLTDRVDIVGGSFLEEIPTGGDLYLIKQILCDWDDPHAERILANAYRAAAPGSTLLLIDWLLPDEADPASSLHLMNLGLLLVTKGRARSHQDYRSMVERAGFQLEKITAIPGLDDTPWSLVQARRP